MNHISSRRVVILSVILFIIIRLLYFYQFKEAPYTAAPAVDCQYHHEWAIGIITGKWSEYVKEIPDSPFFRAPLYPYFVSIIYKISNFSNNCLYLVQSFLSLLTMLVYLNILKKIIGNKKYLPSIQLIFSILYIFTGSILYFEFQLLIPAILLLIYGIIFYNFTIYLQNRKLLNLCLSALFLGLGAIARPNILLLTPLILFFIFQKEHKNIKRFFKHTYILIFITLLPIVPVTTYNYLKSGDFTLIATQGGINFYIGNNHTSNGWSALVPELKVNNWTMADALSYAEKEEKRKLSAKEHSDFWYKKGVSEIISYPFNWLTLVAKKVYLWHYKEEISNNKSLYFTAEKFSPLLKILLFIGMGIFTPLLLFFLNSKNKISLKYYLQPQSKNFLLLSYLIYFFSFIMFFVNSRYRQPVLPIIILFSAISLHYIFSFITDKSSNLQSKILLLFSGSIVVLFFNLNIFNFDFDTKVQDYYELGNAYYKLEKYNKALGSFLEAEKLFKDYPQLQNNIAAVYVKLKQYNKAIKYFKNEKSDRKLALKNLKSISGYFFKTGIYYIRQNEYKKAESDLILSVKAQKNPDNLFNLGLVYFYQNRFKKANEILLEVLALNPNYKQANVVLQKMKMAR